MPTLLYNPECSKSREARALVEARSTHVELIDYLKSPLTFDELCALIAKLDVPARALVRMKDAESMDIELGDLVSDEDVARLLVTHPALIERPVLIIGERAVIARPPSRVHALLDAI